MKQILSIVIVLFIATLAVKAQDPNEKLKQASTALSAKDYAKAYGLYSEAVKIIDPTKMDPSIYYYTGFSAYFAEKYTEAIVYFDKAIKAGNNVVQAWGYKAKAYNKLNDYANAVNSYEKLATLNKKDKDSLIYLAGQTANKGELYDKALELFTKSVDAGYKGETAQLYKIAILQKQNKSAEYKQALLDGVQKFPGSKKIGSALASDYVGQGTIVYQKGVTIMQEALKKVESGALKKSDTAFVEEVGKAKAEFKSASEIFQKAVALDAANENAVKLLESCKNNMEI
jgi:tetratricopeptide (TPR) repeat protein